MWIVLYENQPYFLKTHPWLPLEAEVLELYADFWKDIQDLSRVKSEAGVSGCDQEACRISG
jgi:hypothetical protein